jgi:hypothetical protein
MAEVKELVDEYGKALLPLHLSWKRFLQTDLNS